MSSDRNIRRLARRADLTAEEALKLLANAGLPYTSVRQLVSQGRLHQVELILGLQARQVVTTGPIGVQGEDPETAPAPPSKPKKQRARRSDRSSSGPLQHQYDLRLVGRPPTAAIVHLDASAVLKIHYQLVKDFAEANDPIEPPGPRDRGAHLLESALTRPKTSLSVRLKYPTIPMAAGALLHALVQDHPFHNGNKRTGIVSLLVFLDLNGHVLRATEEELFDYVIRLAAHRTTDQSLPAPRSISDDETINAAVWINQHCRKLNKSESSTKWRDLKAILRRFGCSFEQRSGNRVTVRRGALVAHTGARNDGAEMDPGGVAHIRRYLELDEEHGIDSLTFYFNEEVVPDFINRYRKLLRRLAAY